MQFVAIWVIAAAFQSLFAESFRSFQRFWLATLFNGLMFDVVAVLVFGWLFIQHRAHHRRPRHPADGRRHHGLAA